MHFQFFGLLGISSAASSMIGPDVFQAIVYKSGNKWKGFPLLFVFSTVASLVIWFGVDVTKGSRDTVVWADSQRKKIPEVDTTGEDAKVAL